MLFEIFLFHSLVELFFDDVILSSYNDMTFLKILENFEQEYLGRDDLSFIFSFKVSLLPFIILFALFSFFLSFFPCGFEVCILRFLILSRHTSIPQTFWVSLLHGIVILNTLHCLFFGLIVWKAQYLQEIKILHEPLLSLLTLQPLWTA